MKDSSAPAELAARAARLLLDTKAVLFRPERPFFFSSGWASPVYVNCKNLMGFVMHETNSSSCRYCTSTPSSVRVSLMESRAPAERAYPSPPLSRTV